MKTIILDGAKLTRRERAMDILALTLDLPDGWGRNLTALHDRLMGIDQPTRVKLADCGALEQTVFGQGLLQALEDSAWENPCVELEEF